MTKKKHLCNIVSFFLAQRAICGKTSGGGRTDFAPSFGNHSFMGKSSSTHQVSNFLFFKISLLKWFLYDDFI